jgi:hypothetical protein
MLLAGQASSNTAVRPCQNGQVTPDQTNPRDNKVSTLPEYCKHHIKHNADINISRLLLLIVHNK